MIFLPIFFMYIFPLFFLGLPVIRTSPIFATVLLLLGFILWMVQSFQILGFITQPKKMLKKHQKAQSDGKVTRAEIIDYRDTGEVGALPSKRLLVSFSNLIGNQVKAYINVVDSKPHERRFESGKYIDLKLNQNGFDPAFTIDSANYETHSSPWVWIWFIFNILYMIAFFLISYYLQNDGYGWRFLNPSSPWLWAPVIGFFLLSYLRKIFNSDNVIRSYYELSSIKSKDDFGELLLFGKTTQGEILDYFQTGTYVNEQPQIRFNLHFDIGLGVVENKSFKKIISLTEMHNLKKGKVEVLYLPHKTDMFMVDFLNDDIGSK